MSLLDYYDFHSCHDHSIEYHVTLSATRYLKNALIKAGYSLNIHTTSSGWDVETLYRADLDICIDIWYSDYINEENNHVEVFVDFSKNL